MILNRKIPNVFADIREMIRVSQPDFIVDKPFSPPEQKVIELAIKLFEEEGIKEYHTALALYKASPTRENLVAVIDGAMDTIVVIAWFLETCKVPSEYFWNEVHRSNMAKFPECEGVDPIPMDLPEYHELEVELISRDHRYILRNALTGKFLKPQGWTPPKLHEILHELEIIHSIKTQPEGVFTGFLKEYFIHRENEDGR